VCTCVIERRQQCLKARPEPQKHASLRDRRELDMRGSWHRRRTDPTGTVDRSSRRKPTEAEQKRESALTEKPVSR
jgi:hypothetical protein